MRINREGEEDKLGKREGMKGGERGMGEVVKNKANFIQIFMYDFQYYLTCCKNLV